MRFFLFLILKQPHPHKKVICMYSAIYANHLTPAFHFETQQESRAADR